MRRLLARRAIQAVAIVWLVASLTFFLLHLAPGDPVSAALGNSRVPQAVREHWRTVLGLDRPLSEQYWRYLVSVARGDPGYSFSHQRLGNELRLLVLPAGTLTLLTAAGVARYQRAAVLEVAQEDFVRTARAKGVDERVITLRHVLRNALLPIITLLGLALPALLGGSVFVEKIFAWPGMGYVTVNAIATRDYPLVTAAVMVGSVMVVAGSVVADLLYALV